MYFCLDSVFSTENHQSSANWAFIGKSLVKRTDSDNKPCVCPLHRHAAQFVLELRAHCGATSGCSSLLWFVGSLLCRLLFAVFNDLTRLRRESCVCASMCAFACPLAPLTCTSFPPVCRAETERGLNRKHIIEGNKSVFLSSALSLMSPHHWESCCSPVISLFCLFSFLPLCLLYSVIVHPAEFESCMSRWHIKPQQMFSL